MVDTNTTVGHNDVHTNTFSTTTTAIASYMETEPSVMEEEPA